MAFREGTDKAGLEQAAIIPECGRFSKQCRRRWAPAGHFGQARSHLNCRGPHAL